MQIKISELLETLNIDADSIFPIVFRGETKKVTYNTLKRYFSDDITIDVDEILSLTSTNPVQNKVITSKLNEVESIAKGANQTITFDDYKDFINAFNTIDNNVYNKGQNVMIGTLEVPDLWIKDIMPTTNIYEYTTDNQFIKDLNSGTAQVGYYLFSQLETQKVDLKDYAKKTEIPTKVSQLENDSNFVKNTDYATASNGGVVKIDNYYGASISASGILKGKTFTYEQYQSKTSEDAYLSIISKGTLENVIEGKELTNKTYVDEKIGSIEEALEIIQEKNY